MDRTPADELGLLQSGDHSKDPPLLVLFQPGLKTDEIEKRPELVLAPQLHNRKRLRPGSRIHKADRLHGAEGQGVLPPLGQLFNGKAPLKQVSSFEIPKHHPLALIQRLDKSVIFFLVSSGN